MSPTGVFDEGDGKMAEYILLRELGNGATSHVFLAADRQDGKKYAVKCFGNRQDFEMARQEMSVARSEERRVGKECS